MLHPTLTVCSFHICCVVERIYCLFFVEIDDSIGSVQVTASKSNNFWARFELHCAWLLGRTLVDAGTQDVRVAPHLPTSAADSSIDRERDVQGGGDVRGSKRQSSGPSYANCIAPFLHPHCGDAYCPGGLRGIGRTGVMRGRKKRKERKEEKYSLKTENRES